MANTTTNPIYSLGEDFNEVGFCDLWTYYPTGEKFAVVVPYASICASSSSNSLQESKFFLEGTMYFGLIFLLIVMVQSMARNRIDWYRLIAFYLIGTLGVPVSIAFGPVDPGFNRFIGFGILVHNMAETAILAVIWRGTKQQSSFGVRLMMVYFWIMLSLITFLDLHVLLWAASFQGATLDFFLVTSFCTVAISLRKKGGKYFWISSAAAILHIITIQPLFLGMALGWTALSVPTVLFLVPTFMLYIWFASSDPRANLSLAKSRMLADHIESQEKTKRSIVKATEIAIKTIQTHGELIARGSVGNPYGNNNNNNVSKLTPTANGGSNVEIVMSNTVAAAESLSPNNNGVTQVMYGNNSTDENNSNNNNNNTGTDKNMDNNDDENYMEHSGQTIREEADTVEHVITHGLFYSAHVKYPMTLFKRALFVALVGSISDIIFLITSPCWIDTSFLCD